MVGTFLIQSFFVKSSQILEVSITSFSAGMWVALWRASYLRLVQLSVSMMLTQNGWQYQAPAVAGKLTHETSFGWERASLLVKKDV